MFALPRIRCVALSLAALAALLALPGGARAVQPVVEIFPNDGTFPIGPCPNGVTLEETFTEVVRVTTFFDRAGNPVRIQIHVDFAGVVTNPATGQSVEDPGRLTTFIDPATGETTTVGLIFSTTVPGVGVVFHDVGKVVFDADGNVTFQGGPHDVLDLGGGDPTALFCAALT